jgi:uncharacterized protein YkwD
MTKYIFIIWTFIVIALCYFTNMFKKPYEIPNVEVLLEMINEYRVNNGLELLKIDERLCEASEIKAKDMRDNGYFAHIGPDKKECKDYIEKAGYQPLCGGDNLAKGHFSTKSLFDAWVMSDSHRSNILDPRYRDTCITILEVDDIIIAVQFFAREIN